MGRKSELAKATVNTSAAIANANIMKEAENNMNEQLLDKKHKIKTLIDENTTSSIERIWRIGYLVNEVIDKPAKHGGDDAFELLVTALDSGNRSFLNQAAHFARDFDKDQLKTLLTMRFKHTRRPISWPYIQRVLDINDEAPRTLLLTQACENEWSPEEFSNAKSKLQGKLLTDRHGGGRPVTVPSSLTGKLSNLEKVYSVILRNDEQIYRNPEQGILAAIKDIPADKLTDELIEQLDRDIEVASEVVTASQSLKNDLLEAKAIAEARKASHERHAREQQEEAIDAEYEVVDNKSTKLLEDNSKKTTTVSFAQQAAAKAMAYRRGAQKPVGV